MGQGHGLLSAHDELDIVIPALSAGYRRNPKLDNITIDDIKKSFARYSPLPIGEVKKTEIDYEGRHLFTNEIVEKMKVQLPLLESGIGAISYYRESLERQTSLRGTHQILAPLIQTFLEDILFKEKVSIFDDKLVSRLSDSDVQEHLRATFVPLILDKTTYKEERRPQADGVSVCSWRPFQVTHSENRPTIPVENTPFNLVPCNREFEVGMTTFLSRAPDVQSFCKNAGPQSLRIDYQSGSGRLAFYTPDFLVRLKDGYYVLVETKGRVDIDVPLKATAAVAWCKAASSKKVKWEYLYVSQTVFSGITSNKVDDLMRTCKPSLADLLKEKAKEQLSLPLGDYEEGRVTGIDAFIDSSLLEKLPSRYKKAIEHAITLFQFSEKKEGVSFAPVFTPLLGPIDESAKGLITELLMPLLPITPSDQKDFFEPYYGNLKKGDIDFLRRNASNLRRTLVFKNGLWPLGLLQFCLDYPGMSKYQDVGGVFSAVIRSFSKFTNTDLLGTVKAISDFRNNYVAHQEKELSDISVAKDGLAKWIVGLYKIYFAH